MSEPFRIAGLTEGIAALDMLDVSAIPAVAGSLYRSTERIMTISKDQEVPLDTGALRSSGAVQIEQTATAVTVTLGYGGSASQYAVAVHEQNKNYKGGRKWKYLEDPIKANLDEVNRQLAEDIAAMGSR